MKLIRNLIMASLALFILYSCNPQKKESEKDKITFRLEEQWATDTLLKTPESVLFDMDRDVIYVSNVNMNPWEKDGNGFISKISPSGEILDLEWVTGFNGPKGMALIDSILFVADLDELVLIDATLGEVIHRKLVDGASGMNDISKDVSGTLYISDSNEDKIYTYKDDSVTVFMAGLPSRPNGQLVVGDHLKVAFSGASQFADIEIATKTLNILADSIGHGDGITPTNDPGNFLVSDWMGEIFIIGDSIGTQSLLDTKAEEKNTADIWFIESQSLVLVPTFFDNRVVAYKLIKE